MSDTNDIKHDANSDQGAGVVNERGIGKKKISGHIIINKNESQSARWYVVHTNSGHEARVAETLRQRIETMGLEDKIFEILVPTQDRVVIRSGKKAMVKEKIFPGYMLIKMDLDDSVWLAIKTTAGITGFVGSGKNPSPLSETEVENILKFVSSPAKRFKTRFTKSEAVKIIDGPFTDFLGTIDEIDEERGKVKVLVSIFGRETPVELDLLQITKIV
jgi:transcriptional antiterminator NusG